MPRKADASRRYGIFQGSNPITRAQVRDDVRALQRRLGLATVLVTHDVTEALLLADRIAIMRDGRIEADGDAASLVREERNAYARALIDTSRRDAGRVSRLGERAP